ncbi:MAG: radical SAM protein [archaeon]|nr:radical SAM protein [archaeon]
MGSLYTNMKIFHYKEKIDSLPESVDTILPPIHIRIKPTNVCNHNCRYCAYRAQNLQLGKDMRFKDAIPKEKMLDIVDELDELGVQAVTFSGGGEPFCYPHLLETIKKFSKTKIKFAALTNGSRLNGDVAELFAHYGTWLRVSIDGWDDKSYSNYRGVGEGAFTEVMQNMENFKNLKGNCYLGVSIIVDRINANQLYYLIGLMKNAGVDSVKVSPCIISNDSRENNKYHQSIYKSVKAEIEKAVADLTGTGFEIYDSYHELNNKFHKSYSWCPYLQILPIIGADLNIYSCQDKAYNLKEGLLGTMQKKSFKNFWFSEKKQFFSIDPSKHCNHHCIANNKNELLLEYLNRDHAHGSFV